MAIFLSILRFLPKVYHFVTVNGTKANPHFFKNQYVVVDYDFCKWRKVELNLGNNQKDGMVGAIANWKISLTKGFANSDRSELENASYNF